MHFSGQVSPTLAPAAPSKAPGKVRRILRSAPACLTLLALLAAQTEATVGLAQAPATPTSGQQTLPAPPASPTTDANDPNEHAGEITEEQLKQQLVGKPLFLRGGYLGDSLSFTEHGDPIGHPTVGSYTLSAVQIDKIRLTKHRVELEGARYALHFLGALPYEDPSKAVDRIKITPKKKVLKISIDREQVVKPRKTKEAPREKSKTTPPPADTAVKPASTASSETDVPAASPTSAPVPAPAAAPVPSVPPASAPPATEQAAAPVPPPAAPATDPGSGHSSSQNSAQSGEQAGEPAADRPADQASVTTTISPAHAAKILREALDKIFAPGLDDKIRAQMPEFWQLYYRAQTAGVDYRPSDPKVLRSSAVDQQAKLLSSIAPDSNEFAQASGIAGRALYRVVIEADGKPGEIAVVRPIGFGLDENAVAAIRKASFQPAIKGGQQVAETLDLAVLFRIYSKRTSVAATEIPAPDAAQPKKPGPYTIQESKTPQP